MSEGGVAGKRGKKPLDDREVEVCQSCEGKNGCGMAPKESGAHAVCDRRLGQTFDGASLATGPDKGCHSVVV